MVKGFSKMYNFSFFRQIFFWKHFYFITGFCDKKFNFCKFEFFTDSKSRAQELSNFVSFVIFGHKTWDLEGGVNLTPNPSISWFSSTPAKIGLIRIFNLNYAVNLCGDRSYTVLTNTLRIVPFNLGSINKSLFESYACVTVWHLEPGLIACLRATLVFLCGI